MLINSKYAIAGSICSQHAIEMILVSKEVHSKSDSNDLSPMCISCKITKLFKLFLHRSECEHTIAHITELNCLLSDGLKDC